MGSTRIRTWMGSGHETSVAETETRRIYARISDPSQAAHVPKAEQFGETTEEACYEHY